MAQGGKSYNDRLLAARVRTLALKKVEKVLLDDENQVYDKEFQKALLLRLAGTILPRLNEHSGEDGEPIKFNMISYEQAKNIIRDGEGGDKGNLSE